MKKTFLILTAVFALAVSSFAQSPNVYTMVSGGTNNVAAGVTNTFSSTLAVSEYDYCAIQFSVKSSAADAGQVILKIPRSLDSTTYETAPGIYLPLTLNGTTLVTVVTNVPIFGVATFGNPTVQHTNGGAFLTNVTVKVRLNQPRVKAQ